MQCRRPKQQGVSSKFMREVSIFNGGSDALVEQQVAIDFDSISAVERKEMLPDCSDVRLRRLAIRRKESIFSVRSSSLSASYLNLPYWLDASTCNTTDENMAESIEPRCE